MMSKLAMAVGVLYFLLGVAVAVSPDWFLSVVDWPSRQGLYVAAGIRVIVGLVLLLAAPASRFPRVFRVIGAIALAAGMILPFVSIDFWGEWMRYWTVDQLTAFRTTLAISGTIFRAFMTYAAAPKGTAT